MTITEQNLDEGLKMEVLLLYWYLTFEFLNVTGAGLQYTANCHQRSHTVLWMQIMTYTTTSKNTTFVATQHSKDEVGTQSQCSKLYLEYNTTQAQAINNVNPVFSL